MLNNEKWCKLPLKDKLFVMGQQSIINTILESEKEKYNGEYTFKHNGSELTLTINGFGKDLKATIKNINIGEYGGFYDHKNEISLNIKFCRINQNPEDYKIYNDPDSGYGKGIYENLTHELHHAFQIYLIKHKNEILQQLDNKDKQVFKEYVEQLNACMSNDKINLNCFNFNFTGTLSIKPYEPIFEGNDLLESIANIFYYLNISEYEAFPMGTNCLNNLSDLSDTNFTFNIPKEMRTSFTDFIERYKKDFNPTDNYEKIENVVNIISNCMLKVYNNEQPKTKLEASIMYDICCIAHLHEIKLSLDITEDDIENREQECINLLQKEIKEKTLQPYNNIQLTKNNIKVYNESEFYIALSENLSLQNLSEEQRNCNPKLVLYLTSFYSYKHTDCFSYATDELKEYCQEEKQNLYNNPVYKDGAAIIFGEDFWKELGMEEICIEEDIEDAEYNNYANEQDNQYNSTDISFNNTFNQEYQDFSDDEPKL